MKKIYALWRILDRWKWQYMLAGGLLFLSSLIRMLEPKVIQLAVDSVLNPALQTAELPLQPDPVIRLFVWILPQGLGPEQAARSLLYIGLLFIGIALLQSAARFGAGVLTASGTERAAERVRTRLFEHIQALSMAQMDRFPKGEMIQRCTGDIDTVRRFMNDQVAELLRMSGILVGSFVFMAMVHLPYALLSIAILPPMLWISKRFFDRESGLWEQHEREQDKLTAIIQENLQGVRVVQAFAQEGREWERFVRQNEVKRGMGIQHVDLHARFWPLADSFCNAQVLFSMLFGAYLTLGGQITVGEFAGFFVYAMTITWPMRQLGQIVSQLGMASVAVQRINEVLAAQEEDYQDGDEQDRLAPSLRGEIEFRNVSFRYPETAADKGSALQDVSFRIEAGEQVGFMGGTGAGKSTVAALLLRFYEPDSGQILLDGKPLADYPKTYLRRRLGWVHQKAFLFSSSLQDNLLYANPGAEDRLPEAAEAAQVSAFVPKLHKGYETVVGERGVALSGGQKQRAALARTLLADPDVLLLDDSTSAVDTETEHAIQTALRSRLQGKTTIVIAHRLTSLQYARRIFVFDQGRIIEQGSHTELMALEGFYKKVYEVQAALEAELL